MTVILAEPDETCRWCGQEHGGLHCPLVKSYDLDPAGNITHVEFVTPAEWEKVSGTEVSEDTATADYPRKQPAS